MSILWKVFREGESQDLVGRLSPQRQRLFAISAVTDGGRISPPGRNTTIRVSRISKALKNRRSVRMNGSMNERFLFDAGDSMRRKRKFSRYINEAESF